MSEAGEKKIGRIHDLAWLIFGELTALRFDGIRNGRPFWLCRCSCGNHKTVAARHLRGMEIQSCGCIWLRKRTREETRPSPASGVSYIPLTHGSWAIIDEQDLPLVSGLKWHLSGSGYAISRGVLMHRLIMDAQDGVEVDHRNYNALDCRRENLRLCTHAQNGWNTKKTKRNRSGYKGVCWSIAAKKWSAEIRKNGDRVRLGLFNTTEEAHSAYCAAATRLHGEFARFE